VPSHHAGLPTLAESRPGGKARIHVVLSAPEVEVRSLTAYEVLAGGTP
jgi:hypothetical protein